jgi:hypothetical protein
MDQKKRIKREEEKGGKKDSTKNTTITAKKKRKMLATQFMKETCFLSGRKTHVSWIQKYITKLQLSSTV